jgi:NTP pyrophosphatase (non-canonical NTP hydrolase)
MADAWRRIMEEILQKIREERTRQDEKWGVQNHDDFVWNAILVEEVGEVSKALLTGGDLESELVQAAAVAIAWLESLTASPTGRGMIEEINDGPSDRCPRPL